jgi:hypothetical protein
LVGYVHDYKIAPMGWEVLDVAAVVFHSPITQTNDFDLHVAPQKILYKNTV